MNVMHDDNDITGASVPDAAPPPPGPASQPTGPGGGRGMPSAGYALSPGSGAQVSGTDPRVKLPLLAGFLSLMPGLGQIYVGFYKRGFVHAIVVASLITLLNTGDLDELAPLAGVFLAFFWLYNVIDAVRRAGLYNQALAGGREPEMPDEMTGIGAQGSLLGGAVLIAAGVVLLLYTRFDVSMEWLREWWPVIPILVGVYLFVRGIQERSANE